MKARAMDQIQFLKSKLLECLGGPWPKPCPLDPEWGQEEDRGDYSLTRVTYEVEPGDRVPALLLVPKTVDRGRPLPGILVWHQHNGEWHLGKSEPAGLAGNPMHYTGAALAREGYVVLCPDALCFEERQSPYLTGGDYERFVFLRYVVEGKCLAWKNILDMRRAVDLMASLPFVDSQRLGCYGHSMGSTFTWLVGPWEERLRCLVGNCCLPTYAAIHRRHILHCFPNFIPGWMKYGDTPHIAGLIAPRPLHLNFGELDGGSPIQEVREGIEIIRGFYRQAGAEENFRAFIQPGVGHILSPEMWELTRQWFAYHLKDDSRSQS
ncbi:MAG: dienelactone hydrolase family protein [Thermogutta sp.]